jgi:hypothetical protein
MKLPGPRVAGRSIDKNASDDKSESFIRADSRKPRINQMQRVSRTRHLTPVYLFPQARQEGRRGRRGWRRGTKKRRDSDEATELGKKIKETTYWNGTEEC